MWLCYNEREREKEQIQMKGLMCGTRWVVWVFCFVLFRFVYFLVPVLYRWRRFSGREVRYEVGWFSSAVESDDQVKR